MFHIFPPRSGRRFIFFRDINFALPTPGQVNFLHLLPTAASLCSLQWATLLHPLCGLKNVRRMFAKLEKGTPDSFRSESRMTREDIGMTREDVGTAREDVGIAREDVGMARDWKCAEFAP